MTEEKKPLDGWIAYFDWGDVVLEHIKPIKRASKSSWLVESTYYRFKVDDNTCVFDGTRTWKHRMKDDDFTFGIKFSDGSYMMLERTPVGALKRLIAYHEIKIKTHMNSIKTLTKVLAKMDEMLITKEG